MIRNNNFLNTHQIPALYKTNQGNNNKTKDEYKIEYVIPLHKPKT